MTPPEQPAQAAHATPKSALLRDLIAKPDGATLADICTATSWLPHSARAAISGLRKQGAIITLATDNSGARRYRMSAASPAPDGSDEVMASAAPQASEVGDFGQPDQGAGERGASTTDRPQRRTRRRRTAPDDGAPSVA